MLGNFDNANPRSMLDSKEIQGPEGNAIKRANGAHMNGVENFPIFASAVLACKVSGVDSRLLEKLAIVYVGTRVFYNYIYIIGDTQLKGSLRSITWAAGWFINVYLFIAAARKAAH